MKWVTESNRPVNIVDDHELRELLRAGRPQLEIPSPDTLARKVHLAFEQASKQIRSLLHVSFFLSLLILLTQMQSHPGHLHFATDAWTSPNHRAFVAWTVHLEHEGKMFSFLPDIIEVAEVN